MENGFLRAHTCCFTGHRILAPGHEESLPRLLEQSVRALAAHGVYRFVTGGALGFDTMAAQTVLSLREEISALRLIVVAPYLGQADGWSMSDRFLYERIRGAADDFRCLAAGYTRGCLRRRNHEMVDLSGICLAYLTHRPSGSAQTADYALQSGLKVINLAELLEEESGFPALVRPRGDAFLRFAEKGRF